MKHCNPIDFKENNFRDYGDPYVLRHDGTYYLYFTSANPEGLPRVYSSLDLINYEDLGEITSDPKAICSFAPEVLYAFGKFYMVTSPRGNGHYVFTSTSPTGPFIRITDNINSMIDGSLFVSKQGKLHFLRASSSGTIILDMDENGNVSNHRLVPLSLDGWTEGPSLINYEGKYYLFYCGNHYCATGYRVNYAVSRHLDGPYVDGINNPLIISTDTPISKLGHSSEVLSPDLCSYLIFYHGMENAPGRHKRVVNFDRLLIKNGNVSTSPTFFEVEKYRKPTNSYRGKEKETVFNFANPAKKEFVLEAFMDNKTIIELGNGYSLSFANGYISLIHDGHVVKKSINNFDFNYSHTVRIENKDKLYIYIDTANVSCFDSILPGVLGYKKEKGNHVGFFGYSNVEDNQFKRAIPGYYSSKFLNNENGKICFDYVAKDKTNYELSLLLAWKEETVIKVNGKPYKIDSNKSEFVSLFVSLGTVELEKEGTLYIEFDENKVQIVGLKLEEIKSLESYSNFSSEEKIDKFQINETEGNNEVSVKFVNKGYTPYSEAGILLNVTSFSKDTIQCRHHLSGLFVGFRNKLLVIDDYRYKATRVFDKPLPIEENKKYSLRVSYKDSLLNIYLDDSLMFSIYHPSLNTFGRDGLYRSENSNVEFSDFKARRVL